MVVRNEALKTGRGNSIPKQNVIVPARYMEYILHVKNCRHGDVANSEVEKRSSDYTVGFTLSQATKALRESRGIALLYFRPRQ